MASFRPAISGPLLEGWFANESMTFLAPDGQANVIASSEPLAPGIDTEQYASIQGDLLVTEFPGYREYSYEAAQVFGGRPGFRRRFEWAPPDGVPVMQIQLYYAESERGYTATATTPSSEFERFEFELQDILDGLDFEAAPTQVIAPDQAPGV